MVVSAPQKREPAVGLRKRQQQETRKRIIDAATCVFREMGYEAATLREIAARAKVATGTLFLYAPEKASLLVMVHSAELDKTVAHVFETMDRTRPLLEQLVAVFRVRYQHHARHPRMSLDALQQASILMKADELPPDSEGARFLARQKLLTARVADLIEHQKSRGGVRADVDSGDAAAVVMAIYASEVRMWLRAPRPRAADGVRVLERRMALALEGICPR